MNLLAGVLLAALSAETAASQEPDHRHRREELRHRIEERFTTRVRQQLGLTDEQTRKLQETSREFGGRRRELEARERAIRDALTLQLRPGVAANRDSVTRLTDAAVELRVAYAETFRDELKETSKFLDPVQRAQLFTMRDRLLSRAREIRGERWHGERHRWRRRSGPTDSAGPSPRSDDR
jgi:hypothetical protein